MQLRINGTQIAVLETCHEISINYESRFKTQLIFIVIFPDNSFESRSSLHFKLCQTIYPFMTFIVLWRNLIWAIVTYLWHSDVLRYIMHDIFVKFLEMLLENNVTSSRIPLRTKQKSFWPYLYLYFYCLLV